MQHNAPFSFEDQTRFATEEPMYEPVTGYPQEEKKPTEPVKPLLKRKGVLPALIIGSVVLVLFLLFVINMIILSNRRPQVPEASPLPVTDNGETQPLVTKVSDLEKELKAADPNQPQLVFPSVDLKITLDEVKN